MYDCDIKIISYNYMLNKLYGINRRYNYFFVFKFLTSNSKIFLRVFSYMYSVNIHISIFCLVSSASVIITTHILFNKMA